MPESRTRERALSELLRLLPEVKNSTQDEAVQTALTASVVNEVFTLAWDHQFDDDRTAVTRGFKEVVREAIEGLTREA